MTDYGHDISAIILAAGSSSRMKDFKPLMRIGEDSLLEHCIRLFRTAGIRDIRVVTGYRSVDIIPLIEKSDATALINNDYEKGMYASVLTGLRSLDPHAKAFFIHPVDIPLVQPATVRALIDAHRIREEKIFHPNFNGKRGHPPLISVLLIEDIRNWKGKNGLSGFLAQHKNRAFDIAVSDEGVLLDLDTPEDYERLCGYYRRYESAL